MIQRWKERARLLQAETYALWLAYKDPRVPWYAKAFAAVVVAYAFSPIDLIPDFIPVLGYVDDLVLIPLGVSAALKMIPAPVMEECRDKARETMAEGQPVSRATAAIIVVLWVLALAVVAAVAIPAVRNR